MEWALARAVTAVGSDGFAQYYAGFLRQCAPFDNFIVLAYKGEEQPAALYREAADPMVFHAMESEYLTAAYLLDPFHKAHLERIPHGVYRLLDLAPDQFKRSSYYQVYCQKTTLIDEIAVLILQGHSSASIGLILGISPHTVKVFRKQLYAKCAVGSQVELFAMMMPPMAEASDGDVLAS